MAQPTTAVLFSKTVPAAPAGNQNVLPASDGSTPQQSISFAPQKATASLLGVVKPGAGITIDATGTITATGAGRGSAGIVVDGGGSTPTTGSKGFIQMPYAGTIVGWTMLANVVGSAQFNVNKSTYAGFPATISIVAAAPPALSSAQNATSSTLTGWTTTFAQGDILEFNLSSVSALTRIILQLTIQKA